MACVLRMPILWLLQVPLRDIRCSPASILGASRGQTLLPAMVPWGPKIETGYLNEPQLFRKVNGEFDETDNLADENPTILNALKNLLEGVRNNRKHFMEFQ